MSVKNGSKVTVDYVGTLDDGREFDSSIKHGKSLVFEVGKGNIIKGFETVVLTMNIGDEKNITIHPAEAYGNPRPEMVQYIPRDKLPQDKEPMPGMMLTVFAPDGKTFPATIVGVTAEEVTLDLNHPLAGKTLHFKIKLLAVA